MLYGSSSVFFFKQKTAYEMRISDWSSDVCSSYLCLGEAVLERAHQRFRLVAQQNGADSLVAGGSKDGAVGALADREADAQPGAAGSIGGRRHAEQLGGLRIEAAAGIVAGVVDRLGHRGTVRQRSAQPGGPLGRGVGLRREAGRFLEDAVEVEAAEAGGLRQIVQARHLLGLGNEAAGLGHRRGMAAAGGRGVRPRSEENT